jgi:hypothetical protein
MVRNPSSPPSRRNRPDHRLFRRFRPARQLTGFGIAKVTRVYKNTNNAASNTGTEDPWATSNARGSFGGADPWGHTETREPAFANSGAGTKDDEPPF